MQTSNTEPTNVSQRHWFTTADGEYELVDTDTGEWVRTLAGRDWVTDVYGAPWVQLMASGQSMDGHTPRQWFDTGLMHHDVGEFLGYDNDK